MKYKVLPFVRTLPKDLHRRVNLYEGGADYPGEGRVVGAVDDPLRSGKGENLIKKKRKFRVRSIEEILRR